MTPRKRDCTWCGLPMYGGPSMGGDDMCSWCDCGVSRDEVKHDLRAAAVLFGRGSVFGAPCSEPTCIRHRDHPGVHVTEDGSRLVSGGIA